METKSFYNNDDILNYINYISKDKEVCLLGSGDLLKEVFANLENKFDKKTYFFSNHETLIITSTKA